MNRLKGCSEDHTSGCRRCAQTRGLNGRLISTDGACQGGNQIRCGHQLPSGSFMCSSPTLKPSPHRKCFDMWHPSEAPSISDSLVRQLGPEEREKRRVGQQAEEWCTNYMIDTYYLKHHNRNDPVSPFKAELANLGSSSAVN